MKSHRTSPYLLRPVRTLDEVRAQRAAAQAGQREPEVEERLDNDTIRYAGDRR